MTLEQMIEDIDVAYAGDVYQAQGARARKLSWAPVDLVERDYRADMAKAREKRRLARTRAIEDWRLSQLVKAGRGYVSPYLTMPLRSEAQARRDMGLC